MSRTAAPGELTGSRPRLRSGARRNEPVTLELSGAPSWLNSCALPSLPRRFRPCIRKPQAETTDWMGAQIRHPYQQPCRSEYCYTYRLQNVTQVGTGQPPDALCQRIGKV